jgi:hypothetical protein
MGKYIHFVLSQMPFAMLILALGLSIIRALWTRPLSNVLNWLLRYILFFAVGISGIWGFVMHTFFQSTSAGYIGWQPSPFEYEVAFANLGMGLAGLYSVRKGYEYFLACTLFAGAFLWGAAVNHIVEIVTRSNFSPGNAGLILYADIAIPLFLFLLLRHEKEHPMRGK